MADMDGLAVFFGEEEDVADGIVHATVDLDVMLDAEETGLEALGGKAGGVHVYIADSSGELAILSHGTQEGLFHKNRRKRIENLFAQLLAERGYIEIDISAVF